MALDSRFAVVLLLAGALSGCLGDGDGNLDSVECEGSNSWSQEKQSCHPAPWNGRGDLPWYPSDGASEKQFIEIPGDDGHMIPVTVYRPLVASAQTPVPSLLHSHGFSGSRMTGDASAQNFVAAGFAVFSFDQRGHGDARDDSEVNFMHPDAEVLDVNRIIDYIAEQNWTLKEPGAPMDPVLGGYGYSYAGGMQLMGAIFDDRIDAIVPEITWNNIVQSLAPNGAIKSGWVDFFYLTGTLTQTVVFSQDFHAGLAWAAATNEMPEGQAPGVPDLVGPLTEASPSNYPGELAVPTLLIQGMSDTLFPLNEAAANYAMLNASEAPRNLYTHLGGHVLNTGSYGIPIGAGLQGAPGGNPCGGVTELTIAWHQKWLLNLDTETGPEVCISLEDGRAIIGDAFPLESTEVESIDVGGPWPIAQAVGGSAVPLHQFDASAPTIVAGIPRLHGTITSPGPDAIIYFSFYKVATDGALEHIVNDQVMPFRLKGPNTGSVSFELELGGIATQLAAGESMTLMATSIEPMYFGNSERLPAGVVLDELILELPIVANPTFRS